MIDVREATAADRDAILALRARCFAEDDPEKRDPRFWDWEFRDGRMFVAAEAERVVAHLGFVRQGDTYLAVDAMTDPDHRRRRLFTRVVTFASDAIASDVVCSTAWQIRRPVRGGMEAGGWVEAGGARVLMRPLFHTLSSGGQAPSPVPPNVDPIVPRSRTGEGACPPLDSSLIAASERLGAINGKPARYLRWRYFENPLWQYDVACNDDAYLVTRVTKLKDIETLAVVDAGWREGRVREASRLLNHALRTAPTRLAAALVTRAHPAFWWLVRQGFLPGPYRFRLLVNNFSLPAPRRWALMWGDTDHL